MPWLELYKAPPIKKSTTYGTYLDLYHTHYLPCLGEMKLCEITQDTIQTYYHKLPKNGAQKAGRPGGPSAKTIRNHHMFRKDFFGYAQGRYELDGNPTDLPAGEKASCCCATSLPCSTRTGRTQTICCFPPRREPISLPRVLRFVLPQFLSVARLRE